jgi:hypothetical protein
VRSRPARLRLALTAALAASLWGCSFSGPTSIRTSRSDYNVAIAETTSEQLLLNLVRLHYTDVPLFLEVSSVTTSFSLEADGRVGGAISTPDLDLVTLSGGLSLAERPTVTYLPLQGEDFVKKLMTPVEVETLALMYHSGWPLDHILKLCVPRLGPLVNAARASGPTPRLAPEYEAFFEAAELLQRLFERGDLEMGLTADDANPTVRSLVMRFAEDASGSPEVQRLKELLGLPAGQELTGLTASQTEITGDAVALYTRSIMACMFFLSQGVDTPEADRASGRVTSTLDAEGNPFDWRAVTGGLMRISAGTSPPDQSYVSIRYRGTWYWIDDSDLDSKATFALLGQLLELQSGGGSGLKPVLTLPVG